MARIEITDEQITAAQGGDAGAMWEIVEAFDGMLKSIVRSVAPRATREQQEDYLQDGRAVLLQLIHDYDSTVSSASLSSFVYRGVRRAVAEADVSSSTPLTIDPTAALRVKRALWEAGGNMDKAWESFRDAESSTKRMSREAFVAMVEALTGTESLDGPIRKVEKHSAPRDGGEPQGSLADVIPDPSADLTTDTERRDYARWLLTQLNARQSFALSAFYGVNMTAIPDAQAAAYLGVKPARLRRIRFDGCASARRVAETTYWVPKHHEYARTLAA
ncbi:hypothetical protein ACGFZB_28825 [Streptomyces cinerochromogenes]|uniref:RNA polymerase sigma-70 region 2 domain-containing protein n=1 Tax=Streptomyces cinerochromogenes TaxID=66422 RepID=A0ABW7BAX1_9ACTN